MSATSPADRVPGRLAFPAKKALLVALALILLIPAAARAVVRTPSGWVVNPVGRQILLSPGVSGFLGPLGTAILPNGWLALSVSSGAMCF